MTGGDPTVGNEELRMGSTHTMDCPNCAQPASGSYCSHCGARVTGLPTSPATRSDQYAADGSCNDCRKFVNANARGLHPRYCAGPSTDRRRVDKSREGASPRAAGSEAAGSPVPAVIRGRGGQPDSCDGAAGPATAPREPNPTAMGRSTPSVSSWLTPLLRIPRLVWAAVVAVVAIGVLVVALGGSSADAGCVADANDMYRGGSSEESGVHAEWQNYVDECTAHVG